jgi:hypothetical protein
MDLQPPNIFVRGYENAVSYSAPGVLRVYHYFPAKRLDPGAIGLGTVLKAKLFVTPWGSYGARQAQEALALPGSQPTHVVALDLPAGVRVQGPAWIQPIGPAQVQVDPSVHRYGNGLELLLPDATALSAVPFEVRELGP